VNAAKEAVKGDCYDRTHDYKEQDKLIFNYFFSPPDTALVVPDGKSN